MRKSGGSSQRREGKVKILTICNLRAIPAALDLAEALEAGIVWGLSNTVREGAHYDAEECSEIKCMMLGGGWPFVNETEAKRFETEESSEK